MDSRTPEGNIPPRRSWHALVLDVPERVEDEIAGRLTGSALGAELVPLGGGTTRIRLFHLSAHAASRARERAVELVGEHGLEPRRCSIRLERVDDDRWAERYQASLRPFAIGERFTVCPSGERRGGGPRRALALVPGRAFGTGEHPTTRLCVEMLERRVRPGSRWIDIGCGTAILAMVAHHCGAGSVLAVDDDSEAVSVAREVLTANDLREEIPVLHGSLGSVTGPAADGIVANISARFFLEGAAVIAELLRPRGLLIATGFLAEDAETVARGLREGGVIELERTERDGWIALLARSVREEPVWRKGSG